MQIDFEKLLKQNALFMENTKKRMKTDNYCGEYIKSLDVSYIVKCDKELTSEEKLDYVLEYYHTLARKYDDLRHYAMQQGVIQEW